jgi:GT2 family glycosyltransferase
MAWLPGCLDSVFAQDFAGFDVVVVDNGSDDGSVGWIEKKYPQVNVICNGTNLGFAAAVNQGIAAGSAEYAVLLNTDTLPRKNWLGSLVEAMDAAADSVGGIASKMLLFADNGLIENAGDILSWYGETLKRGYGEDAAGYADDTEVFSVCAGAALYRRSCLEAVGGFDERFFAYLEDVDLGLRAVVSGWRFLYAADAEILHHGHASGLKQAGYVRLVARNRLLMFFKSVPAKLLVRNMLKLLYGQWYFMLVYRHPAAYLHGVFEALALLPRARRECRELWKDAKISSAELEDLIVPVKSMKTIRQAIAEKLHKS